MAWQSLIYDVPSDVGQCDSGLPSPSKQGRNKKKKKVELEKVKELKIIKNSPSLLKESLSPSLFFEGDF